MDNVQEGANAAVVGLGYIGNYLVECFECIGGCLNGCLGS